MAGAQGSELAAAVSAAGGLGSLPCAMLTVEGAREEVGRIRAATNRGFQMNFFCHQPPEQDPAVEERWRERLAGYYSELGVDPPPAGGGVRAPFDEAFCELVEEVRPKAVSFHFGPPRDDLLERVRAAGCKLLCSATTVREAVFLADKGFDAIIAQGAEAGGHRGMFLTDDVASQIGTFALVPQIVDAVDVPVIAAGGIADGRGIAAAFALGASGVQIGTAYLRTPEARISAIHREALRLARDEDSVLTNVFTGRPARGLKNRADARDRSDQRRRAGLSARRRRADAASREGRGGGLGRFQPALDRSGWPACARNAGRRAHDWRSPRRRWTAEVLAGRRRTVKAAAH